MKKKIYSLLLVSIILLSTGCGSSDYIKDKNKSIVVYEETGQNLQKNILCQPEDTKLYDLYKKHNKQMKVNIDKLPKCDNFKINSGNYQGLWNAIFIKPLAYLILLLGNFLKNYGVSVMVVGLLIRLILLPFSKKTLQQSQNMKKAAPEIQRIEKKYANKNDQESMMAKSQETMMVYKKYGINPMGSCLLAFLQLPLFFAFLEAVNRVPAIFEDEFLGFKLGMTPFKGLSNHQYTFIILIALIILTTFFSFRDSMKQNGGNSEAEKQMQTTMYFMLVFISFASFSLPTAIALYWIVTNGFIIIQNKLLKLWINHEDNKDVLIKPNRVKKGLNKKRGI